MSKGHFGVREVVFLGRTITPEEVTPRTPKIKKMVETQIDENQESLAEVSWISKLLLQKYSKTNRKIGTFFQTSQG